jgi:hypothetical protein
MVDNDSAQNLISKAQIHEVMKGINNREGLFNDEDLKQLDGGYSVSETDDDIHDVISRDSYPNAKGSAFGIYSPNMGSPSAPHVFEEGGERQQAFNGALMGEMAAQKNKYARKMAGMEK